MLTRREFMKAGAAAGAGLIVPWGSGCSLFSPPILSTPLDSTSLTKYIDPLPILDTMPSLGMVEEAIYYEVAMKQFAQKLHSELPATQVWGYNCTYPGRTFEARRNNPVMVKWINNLPTTHIFQDSIDPTIHGAEPPTPSVRSVVHLHGANTPPESDGYPEYWFTPDPTAGPNGTGGPPGNFALYRYPNRQQATTLWYHDHALGITRLNIHAGLAGMYILRDDDEDALNLPKGAYEIALIIQDSTFNTDGSFAFPTTGQGDPLPVPPLWQPEFFGDTILVNGKAWPFLEVEPRKYRFRILNASNARFYALALSSGQPFVQIGTDGGLLPAPVAVSQLVIAPAERCDIVLDFTGRDGETITVTNSGPTPFPGGGDPDDPSINPNTAQVMQFRVTKPLAGPDTSSLPAALRPLDPINPASAAQVRDLTLNEVDLADGSVVISQLGTTEPKMWSDPITENPRLGTGEIWRFIDTTEDTHPIHVHLIQFRVLDRTPFNADQYNADRDAGTLQPLETYFTGPPVPPDPNEAGRKDTVRVNVGTVTRIMIPRFGDYAGKFVWHCHITDHEDNEMMRPYMVVEQ